MRRIDDKTKMDKTKFKKERGAKRYSENWRKKVSKGWFKKGGIPWNKGIKMSTEAKRKLSKTLQGRAAWNKGKAMSNKQKRKFSKLFKGRHHSPKTEFKKGQNKGDKNPAKRIEVRKKISEAKKGKPHFNQRGENHPLWKGGISPENEKARKTIKYRLWRETIFRRDGWSCQKCGKRGGKLISHHLCNFADFSKLRTSIENGITLCEECHTSFHNLYGWKSNTKTWESFYVKFNHGKATKSENG